jgi:hypothetical protein
MLFYGWNAVGMEACSRGKPEGPHNLSQVIAQNADNDGKIEVVNA